MPEAAVGRRAPTSGAGTAAKEWGAGYAVYDPVGQRIGRAVEVFVNLDGEPMYIRVRLGFLFTSTVLIPVQFVETDDEDKTLRSRSRPRRHLVLISNVRGRSPPRSGLDIQLMRRVPK